MKHTDKASVINTPLTVLQFESLPSKQKQLLLDDLQAYQVQITMHTEELSLLQTALNAVQSRYIELYNDAAIGYCTVSKQGLILQANLNAAKLLKMLPIEMMNVPFSCFIFKDDMGIHHHHVEQLMLGSEPQSYELRMFKKDGTKFWAQLLGSVVQDALGQSELRFVMVDTSKRRQTDKALIASGYKFLLLFEKSSFGITDCKMLYDNAGEPIDFQFLDVNQAFVNLIGVNPSYKTATQIFPDINKYSFDWIRTFAKVAKTGEQLHFEELFQFNKRWYDCTAYQSKKDHFVVMLTDITERKNHEEQQRQYTEQISHYADEIKQIYDYAPCGYCSIDKNGYFLHINKMALKWLDFRNDEVVNKVRFQELLSVPSLDKFQRSFQKLQKYGQESNLEVELIRKDGTFFSVLINSSAVYDEQGDYVMSRSSLYDITERKKMEEELIFYSNQQATAARQWLVKQEQLRQQLSSELHDRTSPNLAAIAINLKVIASELQPEQSRDVFDRMEDTLALIADTTVSIREICTDMRPPLLDYAGLAPAIEAYVKQFAQRTTVNVHTDCLHYEQRATPEIESLLFRICQEAMTNSLKHADATMIMITLSSHPTLISLMINDNGVGFDVEQLGMNGYAGLGLLNMKEMTKIMCGRFLLESGVGKGTKVMVDVI
ncbi:MAG: PAS domain S-box protein [Methylococcales bacterium]|nr:MAG: PAS domain S-box protein [Methylococcales bacterium]